VRVGNVKQDDQAIDVGPVDPSIARIKRSYTFECQKCDEKTTQQFDMLEAAAVRRALVRGPGVTRVNNRCDAYSYWPNGEQKHDRCRGALKLVD